jgi:hypothetical protein
VAQAATFSPGVGKGCAAWVGLNCCQGEGRRRLQRTAAFDRGLAGAGIEGAGHARPADIAKVLKIGRASVYRVLGQAST